MPVNYSLLKESENSLMDEMLEFYQFTNDINSKLLKYIVKSKNEPQNSILDEEQFEEINDEINKSNVMQSDLLANCIWIIQKNEPRASHLRFIIAIIYSARNLRNFCDNTYKITRFFNKQKLNDHFFKPFIECYETTIKLSKKMKDILVNKNDNEGKEKIKQEFEDYHKELKNIIRSFTYDLHKSSNSNTNDLLDFIIIIGRLERILDSQENILKDFMYITQ